MAEQAKIKRFFEVRDPVNPERKEIYEIEEAQVPKFFETTLANKTPVFPVEKYTVFGKDRTETYFIKPDQKPDFESKLALQGLKFAGPPVPEKPKPTVADKLMGLLQAVGEKVKPIITPRPPTQESSFGGSSLRSEGPAATMQDLLNAAVPTMKSNVVPGVSMPVAPEAPAMTAGQATVRDLLSKVIAEQPARAMPGEGQASIGVPQMATDYSDKMKALKKRLESRVEQVLLPARTGWAGRIVNAFIQNVAPKSEAAESLRMERDLMKLGLVAPKDVTGKALNIGGMLGGMGPVFQTGVNPIALLGGMNAVEQAADLAGGMEKEIYPEQLAEAMTLGAVLKYGIPAKVVKSVMLGAGGPATRIAKAGALTAVKAGEATAVQPAVTGAQALLTGDDRAFRQSIEETPGRFAETVATFAFLDVMTLAQAGLAGEVEASLRKYGVQGEEARKLANTLAYNPAGTPELKKNIFTKLKAATNKEKMREFAEAWKQKHGGSEGAPGDAENATPPKANNEASPANAGKTMPVEGAPTISAEGRAGSIEHGAESMEPKGAVSSEKGTKPTIKDLEARAAAPADVKDIGAVADTGLAGAALPGKELPPGTGGAASLPKGEGARDEGRGAVPISSDESGSPREGAKGGISTGGKVSSYGRSPVDEKAFTEEELKTAVVYGGINPKAVRVVLDAIKAQDVATLKASLGLENKNLRRLFTDRTGKSLPRTVAGTRKAVDEWAEGKHGAESIEHGAEGKGAETQPVVGAGAGSVAESPKGLGVTESIKKKLPHYTPDMIEQLGELPDNVRDAAVERLVEIEKRMAGAEGSKPGYVTELDKLRAHLTAGAAVRKTQTDKIIKGHKNARPDRLEYAEDLIKQFMSADLNEPKYHPIDTAKEEQGVSGTNKEGNPYTNAIEKDGVASAIIWDKDLELNGKLIRKGRPMHFKAVKLTKQGDEATGFGNTRQEAIEEAKKRAADFEKSSDEYTEKIWTKEELETLRGTPKLGTIAFARKINPTGVTRNDALIDMILKDQEIKRLKQGEEVLTGAGEKGNITVESKGAGNDDISGKRGLPGVAGQAGIPGGERAGVAGEPSDGGQVEGTPGPGVAAGAESGNEAGGAGVKKGRGGRGGVSGRSPGGSGEGGGAGAGAVEPGSSEKAGGIQETPPVVESEPATSRAPKRPTDVNARNYRIPADAELIPGGDVAKIRGNLDAIRLLKELEKEDRLATPEEKQVLAQYVGWGGLPQVFDKKSDPDDYNHTPDFAKKWGKFWKALKDELTEEEYAAARASTINAHYTSKDVIQKVWSAAERLGFAGGRVGEFGAGIGHFLGLAPDKVADDVKFTAVELDEITGRMLKKLYPEATVHVAGLEKTRVPNNSLDMVIGNFPFGKEGPFDANYPKLSLHNYFFARAVDAVKPGGLIVAITSASTLDSTASAKAREMLGEKADLVGGIRLPNTAFLKNAGTKVTTDIVILRKKGVKRFAEGETWQYALPMKTADGKAEVPVNEYFGRHPEMMLGKLMLDEGQYREGEPGLAPIPGAVLVDQLTEAIGKLPANVMGVEKMAATSSAEFEGEAAETGMREDEYLVKDGAVYQVIEGKLTRPKWTPAEETRGKSYIGLRDALAKLRKMQLDGAAQDKDLEAARKELNRVYDAHVKAHGVILDSRGHRYLEEDPEFRLVTAVEDLVTETVKGPGGVDVIKKRVVKGQIFRERTQWPWQAPTRADTVEQAAAISRAYQGAINLDYIAELTGKDKEAARAAMLAGGDYFEDPESGNIVSSSEYLSGNVRKKLQAAEKAAQDEEGFAKNVEALKKVQPARKEIGDIEVMLGATWIPDKVVTSWLRQLFGDRHIEARQVAQTGDWMLSGTSQAEYSAENRTKWATADVKALRLIQSSLNLQRQKVFDTWTDANGSHSQLNREKSLVAQQMQAKLEDEFSRWVKTDAEAGKAAADVYNEQMNAYVDRVWGGQEVFDIYPGAAKVVDGKPYVLRPHQKGAVSRGIEDGSVVFAHAVGSGKTGVLATLAMELKRTGLARKSLIVVQNQTISQFANFVPKLYPQARVLVVSKEDLQKEKRKRFMGRIASGDWDIVIMSHSQFDRIPNDPSVIAAYKQKMLEDLDIAIAEARAKDGKGAPSVKSLEKSKKALEARMDRLLARKTDSTIFFEDLGIDALMVDEAHLYKKNPFVTKMDRIKGLDVGFSMIGMGLALKTQHVLEKTGGRNIYLSTGTPITNTLAEIWNMIRFASPQTLKKWGVDTFDRFASTFTTTAMEAETDAGGRYKMVVRFSKFKNVNELGRMVRSVLDVKMAEDLPNLPKPPLKGGKAQMVDIEQTPQVKAFTQYLNDLYEWFEGLSGKARKENGHVPATIYTLARQSTVDVRLVWAGAKDEPGSKLNIAVDKIFDRWQHYAPVKGTQAVFCDMRRSKWNPGFDAWAEIKAKLIKKGIPEKEIVTLAEIKTDKALPLLWEKVREGTVRVVIGSTSRLGIGVNIQDRLAVLHALDSPLRPDLIEQREGRILRQGNLLSEVEIVRYGVRGTLDAGLYQLNARKQQMINQVLRGEVKGSSIADPGGAISFQEAAAFLSGNPDLVKKAELDVKLRNLESFKKEWERTLVQRKTEVGYMRATIKDYYEAKKKLEDYQGKHGEWKGSAVERVDWAGSVATGHEAVVKLLDAKVKAATVEVVEWAKRNIRDIAENYTVGRTEYIVDLGGIKIKVRGAVKIGDWKKTSPDEVLEDTARVVWSVVDGVGSGEATTGAGLLHSVDSAVRGLGKKIDEYKQDIVQRERNAKQIDDYLEQPFEQAGELERVRKEKAELEERLLASGHVAKKKEARTTRPVLSDYLSGADVPMEAAPEGAIVEDQGGEDTDEGDFDPAAGGSIEQRAGSMEPKGEGSKEQEKLIMQKDSPRVEDWEKANDRYFLVLGNEDPKEVKGYPAKVEGFDLFVHKHEGKRKSDFVWKVTDGLTGLNCGVNADTKEKALADAAKLPETLKARGLDFADAQAKGLEATGATPRYRLKAGIEKAERVESARKGEGAVPISSDESGSPSEDRLRDDVEKMALGGGAGRTAGAGRIRGEAPDWMKAKGETKKGGALVEAIENDKKGDRKGIRSIVQYLNDLIGIEMRQGREQTTSRNPANYRASAHLVRTQAAGIQWNFHEWGHGLRTILVEGELNWMRGHGEEFKAIAEMPLSMASAKNASEGLAEWARRYVVEHDTVAKLPVTTWFETYLKEKHPDILAGLRDAARAYRKHLERPVVAQLRSFSNDQPLPEWRKTLKSMAEWMGYSVASGHPLARLERSVFVAIRKGAADRKTGLEAARKWRNEVFKSPKLAHQSVLGIAGEVGDIYNGVSGTGRNGVRILNEQGNYEYLSNMSAQDIFDKVGGDKWNEFEAAGWALTMLERYAKKNLDYPGRYDGITADDLREVVEEAKKNIPDFEESYKDVMDYSEALLEVAVRGGDKTRAEADTIKKAYDYYWPLPPIIERNGAGRTGGGGKPRFGIRPAKGSAQGRLPLLVALENRTQETIAAYYWNRSMLAIADAIRETNKSEGMPLEAKAAMARSLVRLHLDSKKVATLDETELQGIIAEYLNQEAEKAKGAPLDMGEGVEPKEVAVHFGKDVWRSTPPRAINVIAPVRGGAREFYQVEDPVLFDLFAGTKHPEGFVKWVDKVLTGMTEPWKRAITQSWGFAVGNMIGRDPSSALLLGKGKEAHIKGIYLVAGVVNRLAGKAGYPEARKTTELFSRSLEATSSLAHKARHTAFVNMLQEGIVWDKFAAIRKNPIEAQKEWAAGVPGRLMSLVLKPVDVLNWVMGGKLLSNLGEKMAREGAWVMAKRGGANDEEANAAYETITGNFAEHSGVGAVRGLLRPLGFANAGIQVMYQQYQKFRDPDPAVAGGAWARLATLGLWAAMGWAIKEIISDEEDRKRNRERPVKDRAGYMDVKGFRIPFAYGPEGTVESFVWNYLDEQYANAPILDRQVAARMMIKRVFDLPGSPADLQQPLIRAFAESAANHSFFYGGSIEADWMKALPEAERYYKDTPEFYKKLGEWLNWSPIKIQYVVRNGLARQLDETARLVDRLEKGQTIVQESADIPYIGRLFVRDPVGWGSASVQKLTEDDKKYEALRRRIQNVFGADADLQGSAIWAQWAQCEVLHKASSMMSTLSKLNGRMQEQGLDSVQRDIQRSMVDLAQKALSAADGFDQELEAAKKFAADLEKMKKQAE